MGKLDYKLFSIVIFAVSALMVAGATQYASAGIVPGCTDLSVSDGDASMEWNCDDLNEFNFFGVDQIDETEFHICAINTGTGDEIGGDADEGCTATDLEGEILDGSVNYVSGVADDTADTITLNFEALDDTLFVEIIMTLEQISDTMATITYDYTVSTCPEDASECHVHVQFFHTNNAELSDDEENDESISYDSATETVTYIEDDTGHMYTVDNIAGEGFTPLDFLGLCSHGDFGDGCELNVQPTAGHLTLDPDSDHSPGGTSDWGMGFEYYFDVNHDAPEEEGSGPEEVSFRVIEKITLDPCFPPGEEGEGGFAFLLPLLVPDMYQAYGGGGSDPEPCADLELEKSVDNDNPRLGDEVTYTFTVTNNGSDDVDVVTVADYFDDDELDYMNGSFEEVQGSSSLDLVDTDRINVIISDIEEGDTVIFEATFFVTKIGPITNFAEIIEAVNTDDGDTDVNDPDSEVANGDEEIGPQEDDEASVTITVDCSTPLPNGAGFILSLLVPDMYRAYGGTTIDPLPCADLELTKSVNDNSPVVGGPVTYTFTVTNNGPDHVDEVEVTDYFDETIIEYLGSGSVVAVEGCIDEVEGDDVDVGELSIDICGIDAGETVIFTVTFEVIGVGQLLNFAEITEAQIGDEDMELEIFDPDSTPNNDQGAFTPDEDDEAAVTIRPCTDEEPAPLPEFDFLLGLLVPEMYQAFGGTTLPLIPCSSTQGDGAIYDDPTLGITIRSGYFAISDGFCFDQFCLDVLEYFNHLPIQAVSSGSTHEVTLTAWCPNGARVCNYASVGASPPGTDINSVSWNMIAQRIGSTGDFELIEYDPNNMIGTVSVIVQEIDQNTIQYTFSIQFLTPASIGTVDGDATPPEDNMFVVTEIRDSNGGSARNIFNEGIFVDDIYAYPQVDAAYKAPVEVEPLCLNEDSTKRNTCAFDLVKQWTLKQAEEKLQEMYDQNEN